MNLLKRLFGTRLGDHAIERPMPIPTVPTEPVQEEEGRVTLTEYTDRYARVSARLVGRGAHPGGQLRHQAMWLPRSLFCCRQQVYVPPKESSMFEIGRRYRVTTSDHDGAGSSSATVTAWEAPLLKLERLGSYQIINTAAPQLISAEPEDQAHNDAQAKAAQEIADRFSIKFVDKDG